jgi:hypothetical protein
MDIDSPLRSPLANHHGLRRIPFLSADGLEGTMAKTTAKQQQPGKIEKRNGDRLVTFGP